jgi:hypothetical protein
MLETAAEKLTKTVLRQKFTTTKMPGYDSAENAGRGREKHRSVCRGGKYTASKMRAAANSRKPTVAAENSAERCGAAGTWHQKFFIFLFGCGVH